MTFAGKRQAVRYTGHMPANDPNTAAITVSQLNRKVKMLLDQGLTRLWVEGEISNLSKPASGHIYLTLKDDAAQVSAAWFRQRQRGPAISFKNGDRVLAFGRVGLYEARGNYQLIIEQMEAAGEGVLKRRFDALKRKLDAEGLFAAEHKLELPELPRQIGIVTSPSGAAVRDIISILKRRFPAVPVVIYPAAVQGDAAPAELISAVRTAIQRNECDVLILGRGGGSLEDLWAFNDEDLARTIFDCPVPIVSAVGHEVDFTIADFVADVRAPTPSGAAELVVPEQREWLRHVAALTARIARVGERAINDRAQQLDWLSKRLRSGSPAATLQRQSNALRENKGRLTAAMQRQMLLCRNALQRSRADLMQQSPALTVQQSLARLADSQHRLSASIDAQLTAAKHRSAMLGRALHSVSPLATLDRGYAIVKNDADNTILTDSAQIGKGDQLRARLARGEVLATVDEVISNVED